MAGDFGFEPTKAERDYYFISYNSADQDRVAPIVRKLNEYGLPIWYDRGIPSGTIWDEYIASKIENCHEVILFMTTAVLAKKGTYVRLEYELAIEDYEKTVNVVWMDDIQNQDVPKWSKMWWKRIQHIQGINITRVSETEKQVAMICRALGVETNRAAIDIPPNVSQGKTVKGTKSLFDLEQYFKANVVPEVEEFATEEWIEEPPVRYSEGLEFRKLGDGTYAVTGIGTCMDTELVIPPTTPEGGKVTSIGKDAFEDCNGLKSIEIPTSVMSIGFMAFNGCIGLTSISVHPNNPVYYSQDNCVIERKTSRLVVGIQTSQIPTGVTSIGEGAFWECSGLTSITIPTGVTSIGDYAFVHCSGLTSISVHPNNPIYYSRDNCVIERITNRLVVGIQTSQIPTGVKSIGDWAFYGCSGLRSITIPTSVTSIGRYAFRCCDDLTSISVHPNNPIYYSLDNCVIERETSRLVVGIQTSQIPTGVTSIGDWAFSGCSGLTSITIPKSVTSIGKAAFFECEELTIYCAHPSQPSTWDKDWNYSNRPVKWGYKPKNK